MKAFLAAIRFLTIVPLPVRDSSQIHLARSVVYFPVVGFLIGVAVASFDLALSRILPPLPVSAFVIIMLLSVSGGLHLDGLADTADGFFSSRRREEVLKIMRDSRTGPMGVAAIVCVVGLKFSALASLAPDARWATIVMMPLVGRCSLVILPGLLPYVRPEGGLATVFQQRDPVVPMLVAVSVPPLAGWLMAGPRGLGMAAISLGCTLLFAAYSYARVGGFTGDTLGAACEIIEILPAIVAAASLHGA
jgi:adenosylcobinamide-GDP ribazoletransferase